MDKRKKRRASRSAVLYIPLCVLLIGFLTVFGVSVFTKVLEIEVTGTSICTAEEIIVASGITMDDNLLFVDTKAASQSIRSAKPFVRDVMITCVLPSTISIDVTESTPLAIIAYQDSMLVIDSGCRVLEITEYAPIGLIEVRGFSHDDPIEGSPLKEKMGSDIHLVPLKDVLAAIEKEGIEKDVSYLDVANISKIQFGYKRFKVTLGSASNAKDKLHAVPGIAAESETKLSAGDEGEIVWSEKDKIWIFHPIL